MTIDTTNLPEAELTCANCKACCCRLEVMLITETGIPGHFIEIDKWGGRIMARLEDGWCSALDRNTMMCSIYEKRPWICRELQAGEPQCIEVREEYM